MKIKNQGRWRYGFGFWSRIGSQVVPVAMVSGQLKSLTGPVAQGPTVAANVDAVISMTELGQAPAPARTEGGSILVQRRSLEARSQESLSSAAVTPQAFIDKVNRAVGGHASGSMPKAGQPVVYGPPPTVEEC